MSIYSSLRRSMPSLTPPFVSNGEESPWDMFRRKLPIEPLRRLPAIDPVELSPVPEIDPYATVRTQLPQAAPPPMILSRQGRPASVVAEGDDYNRALIKRRALEDYQPKKESKKHLALRTILNFVGGGIPGAVGTLIGPAGVLDRRGVDRAWQQGELARTDEQIGQLRTDRRVGLQDRLLESQVAENEAEALAKSRVPAIKDIEVGGRLVRPNAQGGYDEVFAPPVKPGTERRPLLRTVTRSDGSTLTKRSDDNGKTWQDVPELEGAAKPPDVLPEQVDQAIASIEAEQKTLGPSPPTEIADTNQWGEPIGKKVNPAYLEWAKRYRELDDEKRKLQLKRKPPALSGTTKLDATEQRIYDAAKAKNLDPDKAVSRYRSGKY